MQQQQNEDRNVLDVLANSESVTTSEFMKCLTTFRQYVQERGVADIETLNVLQRMETHSVMTTLAASNQAKITKYFKCC